MIFAKTGSGQSQEHLEAETKRLALKDTSRFRTRAGGGGICAPQVDAGTPELRCHVAVVVLCSPEISKRGVETASVRRHPRQQTAHVPFACAKRTPLLFDFFRFVPSLSWQIGSSFLIK